MYRERERDRQTDRQTEKVKETERQRDREQLNTFKKVNFMYSSMPYVLRCR